jgi:hypothetical protein
VPVARVQGESAEIVTADLAWRAGDELVLLSRLPEHATASALDAASAAGAARSNGAGGARRVPRTPSE